MSVSQRKPPASRTVAPLRWLLLAALGGPGVLHAQFDSTLVRIAGVVRDPSRQPIEGVEVRLEGGAVASFTSKAGTFVLQLRRAPDMVVRFRRPGYKSQVLLFHGDWSGEVAMEPGVYELPEVSVSARYAKPARYADTHRYDDFFRRRRQGIGEFIDREEIDRRAPVGVGEVLEGRRGIKVSVNRAGEGTTISFARCNELPAMIGIYLDGRKMAGTTNPRVGNNSVLNRNRRGLDPPGNNLLGEALERLSVADIEMIEIFRGPGEIPPEFNDGNCAAIAIWTRQGRR